MAAEKNLEIGEDASARGETEVMYRVVLDGIDKDRETVDSFCIKLSIFIKTPVTRIKYIARNLPAVLWRFESRTKATKLLKLAKEAGGIAHIEEVAKRVEKKGEERENLSCPFCGFPLNKEDEFCPFCMSSLNESKSKVQETPLSLNGKNYSIPLHRLLFYAVLLLVAMILKFAL